MVQLTSGKQKNCRVNRLVAQAFIPNPAGLPEVNHKDGNKDNNSADNLEWSTRSANMRHAFATNLMTPHRWSPEERQHIADKVRETIRRKNKTSPPHLI